MTKITKKKETPNPLVESARRATIRILYTENGKQIVAENKETGWRRYADGTESYPYYGDGDWRGF